MSCLCWNARGLGNQHAIRDLRCLLDERNPALVFNVSQCWMWTNLFKFDGIFAVDCNKRKGGLILMWRDPLTVTIKSYSEGHMDCIIESDSHLWRFTGFYGNPTAALRCHS